MSTLTLTYTMDEIKSEESGQSYSWQGPRTSLPMPRLPVTYETTSSSAAMPLPYHGLAGSSIYRTMQPYQPHASPSYRDHHSTPARPPLSSSHSFPSLKRSYPAIEESSYPDHVSEVYEPNLEQDSSSKPTINPDHRLLSFGRLPDGATVLDQHGRPRSLEVSAQLHGMFFLSEIATNSGEGIVIQPELTCYRRNLFQISGSVTGPSGPLSVITDRGETVPIVSHELSISAMESVDNHVIRLIVIPWKTPPPNVPEPPANQEQEPMPIPIFRGVGDQDINSDLTVQSIAWRRLQFRVATANNGRRKELQQHFLLRLKLTATLANGTTVSTAECTTAPIVVRGRSPRNFQARKEIPLLGSSASSRGQAAQSSPQQKEILAIPERTKIPKPGILELPKRPFQFDPSTFPPSPLLLKHGYNNQWSTQQAEHTVPATTPNYPPPHHAIGYQHAVSPAIEVSPVPILSSSHASTAGSSARPPFFHSSTAPIASSLSYMDSNPRPSKSPRHILPPDLSALPSYHQYDQRSGQGVYPSSSQAHEPREYFPQLPSVSQGEQQSMWTSSEQAQSHYSTSMPPPPPQPQHQQHQHQQHQQHQHQHQHQHQQQPQQPQHHQHHQHQHQQQNHQQHYSFPQDGYVKEEASQNHYTWSSQ